MSTPFGFGGGFLEGLAGSYAQGQRLNLETQMAQRKNVWDTLTAAMPNARPEAQVKIFQKLAGLASTPIHKKLDKSVTDFSDLLEAPPGYAPQSPQPVSIGGQEMTGSVGQAPPPSGFSDVPLTGAGMERVPGGRFPPSGPATGMARVPDNIEPPPVQTNFSSGGEGMPIGQTPGLQPPPYSPWYAPEELAQMKAHESAMAASETVRGQYGARAEAADLYLPPNASPEQRAAFIAGRAPQATGFQQKAFKNKDGQVVVLGYDYHTNTYRDGEGNLADITGLEPLTAGNDANTAFELFKQSRKAENKTDKQISDEWNTTQSQVTGFMSVIQPDGSQQLVPITHGTVTSKGGTTAPLTPPPAVITGAGTTVGGKIVPEVAKSFEAVNTAQGRLDTMEQSLPAALAGDQQAQINLLGAHIGMTIQGNSIRGTQTVWNEAAASAPWLERALARWTTTDPATGEVVITLDPKAGAFLTAPQMKSMVDLGKQRVKTAQGMYDRTKNAVKDNFGMNPPPKTNGAAHPATHSWSKGAWKKANPGGDLAAATAAAQKAGYDVVP